MKHATYFYRRVASDPRLRSLEVQRTPRKGTFVTAAYTNVDFDKLAKFVDASGSRRDVKSLIIPERAAVLDDYTYPIWMRLSEEADPEQMVEREYDFAGLNGKVSGTWDEEKKVLVLHFVVHEK